jgi:hypothetical protein
VSHGNTARMAAEYGDEVLGKVCGAIAADESRHEIAYTRIVDEFFRWAVYIMRAASRVAVRGFVWCWGGLCVHLAVVCEVLWHACASGVAGRAPPGLDTAFRLLATTVAAAFRRLPASLAWPVQGVAASLL